VEWPIDSVFDKFHPERKSVAFLEHMFGFVPHSNSYAPIGTWSTMSIRDANLNFALQACGEAQGTGSGQP